MRIECRHGHFRFFEREAGEIARFNNIFNFNLKPQDDYYTFPFLVDAPEFSFINKSYLGLQARAQYSGRAWEVMRANQFVFDFTVGTLKKIEFVNAKPEVEVAGFYYISSGLILPGSQWSAGKKVTDYSGVFLFNSFRFKYSRVLAE